MSKSLDVSQVLKDFEGKPYQTKDSDGTVHDRTLREILLAYCANGHAMSLTPEEEGVVFAVVLRLGNANGVVTFEQREYNVLKKIVDNGKIGKPPQDQYLFVLPITHQVRQMVDAADTVK